MAPLERLAVTLYFAGPTGPVTFHPLATATVYRAGGDHRFDRDGGAYGETSASWYYLSGVDVSGPTKGGPTKGGRGTVVAFGDSLTDGALSTVDADNPVPGRARRRR